MLGDNFFFCLGKLSWPPWFNFTIELQFYNNYIQSPVAE